MSTHTSSLKPQTATANLTPAPSGILQRMCACGNHTVAGGECAECGKEKNSLQRKANNQSVFGASLSLSHGSVMQRKLTVGASNDPLEQEADRVADQVMAAPAHSVVSGAPLRIQRYTGQVTGQADTAPASVDHVIASSGRPLEPALRQDMEQRFGHDFSRVRVHSGGAAEQSAREVNATAYTVGHNIVFGARRFVPGTHEGRRLIAHELTHVVQQSGSDGIHGGHSDVRWGLHPISVQQGATGHAIQRAGDFDIRGVNLQTASHPSIIYFDMGNTTIPASEVAKITALATPHGRSLTLNGYTSEEGAAAGNLAIITTRIAAVRTALKAAGHTGPIVANPQPTAGLGQLDYRNVRAVEIVPAGATANTPQCQVTPLNPHPENEPCGTSFTSAQPVALTMVNAAVTALAAHTPATIAVANAFFPGVPQATVTARLNSLLTQLGVMATATGKQCHNTCDGLCSRPGYNSGQGPAAIMTLCPAFIYSFTADQRVRMLIHEGMHATSGAPVVDSAYGSQRLIDFLTGAQAATNTDSYVNLILRLQPGLIGSVSGGPPTDPPAVGMSVPEEAATRRALAFLEKWVEIAEWDTSQLYEAIKHNIGRVGGWDPADDYHAATQHAIGWLLTLTDPGPVPPYATPPTETDKVKTAGIHDRYQRMSRAVSYTPISISKGAAEGWAADLGPSFVVAAPFFGLGNAGDQVLHLFRLMTTSMPDVPAGLRSNYADAANQIRWHKKGIGP
jgi:hypothetical protein